MIVEKYRLTLTHTIMVNGKSTNLEEPKVTEVINAEIDNRYVEGYKNHLLDELFNRLRNRYWKKVIKCQM